MVTLLNTIEDPLARQICGDHGDRAENLLEILHGVQHEHEFLSDAALRTIAYTLNLSRAEVHGVASFYHDFKREKQAGTVVKICRAEACQALDCESLIEQAEDYFGTTLVASTDALSSAGALADATALESIYCLGNCALGPAVLVGDNLYGRVGIEKLKSIVEAQ